MRESEWGKRGGDAESSRKCLALRVCSFFVLFLSDCLIGDKPGRACGGRHKRNVFLFTHLVPFLSRRSSALLSLIVLSGGKVGTRKERGEGKGQESEMAEREIHRERFKPSRARRERNEDSRTGGRGGQKKCKPQLRNEREEAPFSFAPPLILLFFS